MATKIEQPIIGWSVEAAQHQVDKKKSVARDAPKDNIIYMHEKLRRPITLQGATYKIKPPICEHALYVTINDIVLNEGTQHEQRRPFEIFINSKNMEQFQWILALTLIMSAVFRKGGEFSFMVDELRSVFDPHGGYYKPGGYRKPSVVAEIGDVIEHHIKNLQHPEKVEYNGRSIAVATKEKEPTGEALAKAQYCVKCSTYSMIRSEGCDVCFNCGYSKCE